jgi:hypothetical protein
MGKNFKVFVKEESDGGILVGGDDGRGGPIMEFSAASVEPVEGREVGDDFSDENTCDGGTDESETDRVDLEEQNIRYRRNIGTRCVGERNLHESEKGRSISRNVLTSGTKELVLVEKEVVEACDRSEGVRSASTVDKGKGENDVSLGDEGESKDEENVGPMVQKDDVGSVGVSNSQLNGLSAIGPTQLEPSEDIESADFFEGVDSKSELEVGLSNNSQVGQVQHFGVAGLVVVTHEDESKNDGEEEGVEISNPTLNQMLESCIQKENKRKLKEKLQKAQSNLVGKPTCLKLVEALKGGRGVDRKKKKKKEDAQLVSGANQEVEDSVDNTQSENLDLIMSGGIPVHNLGSGLAILLNSENQEVSETNVREFMRKEIEARKILDIQEGLGINCTVDKKEEVQRLIQMEDRDQQEKADWEENNGF